MALANSMIPTCDEVQPAEHMAGDSVHPLAVHVTSNYIIVRSIVRNLDWREQARCALVCRLWSDAVRSLQRDYLHSYDFVVQVRTRLARSVVTTLSSRPVLVRPLFAIAFYNMATAGCNGFPCQEFTMPPCTTPCNEKHSLLSSIERKLLSKATDLLSVGCSRLVFMPDPYAETSQFTLRGEAKPMRPFVAGLYVPRIPNVNYCTLVYNSSETVKTDIYDHVDALCETDVIKGLIVFVADRFLLYEGDDLSFLNYFKSKQPDEPFALGGCMVELASLGAQEAGVTEAEGEWEDEDGSNGAGVLVGVVSVPRGREGAPPPRCEFHMYSLVIERTVVRKAAIQECIQTFARSIPEMEFSTALKLSCVGRERTHTTEQDAFRAAFPRTPLAGCYGNGELGINVPPPPSADPAADAAAAKRRRREDSDDLDFSYSYSTVFVYLGWGKRRQPPADC